VDRRCRHASTVDPADAQVRHNESFHGNCGLDRRWNSNQGGVFSRCDEFSDSFVEPDLVREFHVIAHDFTALAGAEQRKHVSE